MLTHLIDKAFGCLTSLIGPENGCLQIFLFWPPTEQNLRVCDGDEQLIRIYNRLEDSMYAILDADTSVYIPAGWLHTSFALKRCAMSQLQLYKKGVRQV